MAKIKFKENDLKRKVRDEVREAYGRNNLSDALARAQSLNVPYDFSRRSYLLGLDDKLKAIRRNCDAIGDWIDSSINVINNIERNAVVKTNNVKVAKVKPKSSAVNKVF